MNVNCQHLPKSSKTIAILKAHNICFKNGKYSPVPNDSDTVTGDCGSITLTAYGVGGGTFQYEVNITSYWYLGPITWVTHTLTWWGTPTIGTITRGPFNAFTYSWNDSGQIYSGSSGSGKAVVTVPYAADRVLNGTQCQSAYPVSVNINVA
jgi:hypothetical protein